MATSTRKEFYATEEVGSVPPHIVERRIEARDGRSMRRKIGAGLGVIVAAASLAALVERADAHNDHMHESPPTYEAPKY